MNMVCRFALKGVEYKKYTEARSSIGCFDLALNDYC